MQTNCIFFFLRRVFNLFINFTFLLQASEDAGFMGVHPHEEEPAVKEDLSAHVHLRGKLIRDQQ